METIKIKNFNLSRFRSLINQSLIVNKQLIFEVSTEFIRSVSYTQTNSCLKFWVCPLEELVVKSEDSLEPSIEKTLPTFDMFILRGDVFAKFLTVFNIDTVDLEITLTESRTSKKHQATSIKFSGKLENGNILETEYRLTTEEMITNKVDDYQKVFEHCQPSESMLKIVMSDNQIQEIKRLIKKLHKSNSENTSYLKFTVLPETNQIQVNDSVFKIIFDLPEEFRLDPNNNQFTFNLLKSDFIVSGNQAFTIFVDEKDNRVLFGANHVSAILWCVFSKASDMDNEFNQSITDTTLDNIDIDDILGGDDI